MYAGCKDWMHIARREQLSTPCCQDGEVSGFTPASRHVALQLSAYRLQCLQALKLQPQTPRSPVESRAAAGKWSRAGVGGIIERLLFALR